MKKLILITLGFVMTQVLVAQSSGMASFTEAIKLNIEMPEQDREMMKNMPQVHTVKKSLVFNASECLYSNPVGNQDLEVNNEGEHGNQMRIVMKTPESNLYSDVKNNVMIHSQEFFGKHFLISGANTKRQWKITGEQKSILDYPCMKAVLQDTIQTEAWFTTKLPAGMGPNGFGGLPGMILLLDIDNGQRIVTASKVELRELKAGELSRPEKGKQVTVEEFEKIKKDKMQEMGGTMGKGGNMRIMIRDERH